MRKHPKAAYWFMMPPALIGCNAVDLDCQKYACQYLFDSYKVMHSTLTLTLRKESPGLVYYYYYYVGIAKHLKWRKVWTILCCSLRWRESTVSFDNAKPL